MTKDYAGAIIVASLVIGGMVIASLVAEKVISDKGGKSTWIWEEIHLGEEGM
jgi:hypothetical protein